MSHTGTVTRPNLSPGIIRVITTGYVISKGQELVFRKPPITIDSEQYFPEFSRLALEERFILFLPENGKKFSYGDTVKFNMDYCVKWEKYLEKYKKELDEYQKDIIRLKRFALVEKFQFITKDMKEDDKEYLEVKKEFDKKKEQIQNFEFKYVATDIDHVPQDYILQPFFDIIGQLDERSIEKFIDGIDDIQTHNLKFITQVNCKNGNHYIKTVKVLDPDQFDDLFGPPEENWEGGLPKAPAEKKGCYVKDCSDVDNEIKNIGQHAISSDEYIPTLKARIC